MKPKYEKKYDVYRSVIFYKPDSTKYTYVLGQEMYQEKLEFIQNLTHNFCYMAFTEEGERVAFCLSNAPLPDIDEMDYSAAIGEFD